MKLFLFLMVVPGVFLQAKPEEKISLPELFKLAQEKSKSMYDSVEVGDSVQWLTKGRFTYLDQRGKKFSCEFTERSLQVVILKKDNILHKYIQNTYEQVKGHGNCYKNFPMGEKIRKVEITLRTDEVTTGTAPTVDPNHPLAKIEAQCLDNDRYRFSINRPNDSQIITMNLSGNMLTLVDQLKSTTGADNFTRTITPGPKVKVEDLDLGEVEQCYKGDAIKLFYAAQKELGRVVEEDEELEEICI